MNEWLHRAVQPEIAGRAARVAFTVGTVLVIINHGDTLVSGALTPVILGKILLTYCVPYCVATYAAVEALRNRER